MMEKNIAKNVAKVYRGNMVCSDSRKVMPVDIEVIRLNNLLVKVSFSKGNELIKFRAMLSEQEEGVLMLVEDKVDNRFILNGISGFLYRKPNIHGGFLNKLDSFYFHVRLAYYRGDVLEIYFLGKEVKNRKDGLNKGRFVPQLSF